MNIEDVLQSKIYVKENSMVSFKHPSEYLNPFLDMWTNMQVKVRAKTAVVNLNKDGSQNISFGRLNVEATDKYYSVDLNGKLVEMEKVFGMIYALDTSQPIIKVYTGTNVKSCLNLMIFGADYVFSADLINNFQLAVDKMKDYLSHSVKTDEEFIYHLNQVKLGKDAYVYKLGKLLENSIRNSLGTSPVIHIAKEISNPKSIYYHDFSKDDITGFEIYNAGTDYLSNKGEYKENPTKSAILYNELIEV